MKSCLVRSLVLACSLPLALPQGWCCLFAMPPLQSATTGADKAHVPVKTNECCPCCQRDPAPDSESPSPAKPAVPQKSVCYCPPQHATLLTSVSLEQVDTGLFIVLPLLECTLPPITLTESVIGFSFPPCHVLHCVWLC